MHAMQSDFNPNTYRPQSLGMLDGNYTDPYAGMASWSYDNPATGTNSFIAGLDISQTMPTNLIAPTEYIPGFADKLRDFNSQYGSTIMGGLQAASGLWGAYNGMQQTKLAKQQMANSLNQWNKNYANQVASYNTRLEDRQNARVAAQGTKYHQDTSSYMEKNRLK